jgi:chloride channel 3/4/5
LSAISVEEGEAQAAPGASEHQIDEEIEEIKRYEVCTNNLGE